MLAGSPPAAWEVGGGHPWPRSSVEETRSEGPGTPLSFHGCLRPSQACAHLDGLPRADGFARCGRCSLPFPGSWALPLRPGSCAQGPEPGRAVCQALRACSPSPSLAGGSMPVLWMTNSVLIQPRSAAPGWSQPPALGTRRHPAEGVALGAAGRPGQASTSGRCISGGSGDTRRWDLGLLAQCG